MSRSFIRTWVTWVTVSTLGLTTTASANAEIANTDEVTSNSTSLKSIETKPTTAKILLLVSDLYRGNYRSILFGHNLVPTTYTLKKNVGTIGIYAFAIGLTDRWMLASSPWIESFYNMRNVHLKYATDLSDGHRLGFMTSYFKSHNDYRLNQHGFAHAMYDNGYKQESFTNQVLYSYDASSVYTVHTALSFMYYIDDERPFSIRMQPFNRDRYQMNFSTLHEARLTHHLGLNGEVGVVGMNYRNPYFHYAGSLVFQSDQWLLQAGLSHTMPLFGAIPDETGVAELSASGGMFTYVGDLLTNAVHPEMQLQVFF